MDARADGRENRWASELRAELDLGEGLGRQGFAYEDWCGPVVVTSAHLTQLV